MSRLPPALARRIDRLARHAHRFHRFSHHPSCDRYAGEVVRLGRRARLCRGCSLAAAGAILGGGAGLLAPPLPVAALLAGPVLLSGWGALALARRAGRPVPKLLTRAAPTALAALLLVGGLRAALAPGAQRWVGILAALAVALVVALGTLGYRQRGPDRAACLDCPQAPPGPRCDGFRATVRRERAFSRLASRWIDRSRRHP